jgi:transcriptional regulator with XRE-family HTH domain
MVTWQSRVADLRKEANMTLAEIGKAIGMTTGGVGDIASGRTKSPRGEVAMSLHALHRKRCGKISQKSA